MSGVQNEEQYLLTFRGVKNDIELQECVELEKKSYDASEAANIDKFRFRYKHFPKLFRATFLNGVIIGYICSTRCNKFTEKTMYDEYDINGSIIAIHSVCIDDNYRRKGFASKMIRNYIKEVEHICPKFDRFELICKVLYSGLYVSNGFTGLRMSDITHGGEERWLHCELKSGKRDYFVVDSFTEQVGKGNPAAVVFCNGYETKEWMQLVAKEFNLAETAFIFPAEKKNEFKFLFFSVKAQVIFCGHATLAACKVIFKLYPSTDKIDIILEDKSTLSAKRSSTKDSILLNFPNLKCVSVEDNDVKETLKSVFQVKQEEIVFTGSINNRVLIEIEQKAFKRLLKTEIDFIKLSKLSNNFILWIITTQTMKDKEENIPKGDFYSRVFAPKIGINEDPVTGSAHSSLFPHYIQENDESKWKGVQMSKRGGSMTGWLHNNRVFIEAEATIVSKGHLFV